MPVQRKTSACVHCRQMKLKCDAQIRFPGSCTRCAKHNLHCSIDPTFKRTPRRQRITAIEKELEEMKASLALRPTPRNQNEVQETIIPTLESEEESIGTVSAASGKTPEEYVFQDLELSFTAQIIDEIEIQPIVIADLLHRYYIEYHPIFPILPDLASFAKQYSNCQLLFWIVIAISSRYSEQYGYYYLNLKGPIQRLATDINKVANEPLLFVQALLLLCWWPFPFAATKEDPSWTYCGLAVHFALQYGIHRPYHISDFFYQKTLDREELVIRQKTWLGCFITNQYLSSHLGVPATIQINSSILEALSARPSWLPQILEQHLKIAYQSYQVCHTLGNDCATNTGLLPEPLTIIQLFHTKFRDLEIEFQSNMFPSTNIALLRAKLQLYSFSFDQRTSGRSAISGVFPRRSEFLRHAASSAMKLLDTTSNISPEIGLWNSNIRLSISYAVFCLLELLPSCEQHQLDELAMRNSISQAWNIFRGSSTQQCDHEARQAAVIEYMSRRNREQKNDDLSLSVESRMAANITYDIAWRAKERFSKSIRDAKPSDYTTAAAIEEFFQSDLNFQLDIASLGGEEASWNYIF